MSDDEHEVEAEESHGGRGHARVDEKEVSEGERVMAEKKARQEEDDIEKLRAYDEQRRIEREKEEEELRQLKEKQERRRQEREEEELLMAQRRIQEEERRKQEEDERKKKQDADKMKKEADKLKRQQMQLSTGPLNIPKKEKGEESSFDKFGNIVRAKAEMGLTKDQHEEQKRRFLAELHKPVDFDGVDTSAMKHKIKEMYQRLCRLEGDKYDLEQRHQRQEYDLKELNERQRQIARNKALKKGIDPTEVVSSRHPPKVPVISKYDRQVDRRTFRERRQLYEVNNAIPHFPNIPPPVAEMEKVIKPYAKKEGEEDDEQVEEEEE